MAQRYLRLARNARAARRALYFNRHLGRRTLSSALPRCDAVEQALDTSRPPTQPSAFKLPDDLPPVEFIHREQRPIFDFAEAVRTLRACALHEVTFEAHVKVSMQDKTRKRGRPRDPIRGILVLPHTFKEEKKVVVLATAAEVDTALAAGAIAAGGEDLLEQISEGKLNFDIVMGTPDGLKENKAQGGRILRAQMPSAKKGTVVEDIEAELPRVARGISMRSSVDGAIPIAFGKLSMSDEQLRENLDSALRQILEYNIGIKGRFIEKITMTTSTGPGFALSLEHVVTPLL